MRDDWGDDLGEPSFFTDEQQLERLRTAVAARDPELLEDFGEADNSVAEALADVLDDYDVDPEVRAAAAIAIGPTLEMCEWERDEDGTLDEGPYGAPLSNRVYQRVQSVLRRLAESPDTPKLLRRRAIEGSVRSPEDWHEAILRELWESGDVELRMTAVFGMPCLYAVDFTAEIESALEAPEEELRAEAIYAAGQLGLARHAREFARLAGDPSTPEALRYSAISAIGRLGKDGDPDLLWELTEDPDETVAAIAEEAFQEARLDLCDLDDLDDDDDLD